MINSKENYPKIVTQKKGILGKVSLFRHYVLVYIAMFISLFFKNREEAFVIILKKFGYKLIFCCNALQGFLNIKYELAKKISTEVFCKDKVQK